MIARTASCLVLLAACGSGSLDQVTPGEVYLGRTIELAITGDGTDFSDQSKVELGAGVTVTTVHATSATELAVTAAVSTAAALGPHDVYVDGAALADAFTVAAPATAEVAAGTARRGGLVTVHLALVEPGRTWTADDVAFFASPGLTVGTRTVTATAIDALVAIDASAPLGDAVLEVHAGGDVFTVPAALAIADTGDAPVLHDALHVQPDAAGAAFAWLDPESPLALVDLAIGARAAGALVLDGAGVYPRPLAFATTRTEVIDGVRGVGFYTGGGGGAFDVTARRSPLHAVTATDDNDSFATATLLGAPGGYVADAALAGPDDVRYFAVDVTDGAVGLPLRVVTLGDAATDTRLAVVRDDQASLLGPMSNDDVALDELVTPVLPSVGRYYIRVEAGADFDAAHGTFSLAVVTP